MSRVPFWRRYARLLGPDPQADVDAELQFHLEAKTDDLIARGWLPDAARQEAERQFGDLRSLRETGGRLGNQRERRIMTSTHWDEFVQDLRHAFRTFAKDRAFALVTVFILGLGIGANTAVFSVVQSLWLRPLPFPNAHELTWFQSGRNLSAELRKTAGLSSITYTVDAFEELQRQSQSFQALTSYNPFFGNSEYTLTGRFEPQAVAGVMVAENFFRTLGVQPVLGRSFLAEECRKGGRPAVLLSHAFWRRQFGSDRTIVGQIITLSKQPMTVVGVLPPSFDFGSVFAPGVRFDVFVPAVMDEIRNWGNTLAVIGRLKPGISRAEAQAEVDVLVPRIMAAHKEWWGDYTSSITLLQDFVTGKLRRSLLVLWCAVGLILLIVCVNLSNLLLARVAARGKEFAMRTALGASRARLVRQLLAESLVLSSAGAILGLLLAFAMTAWLARQGSIALPLLTRVAVDGTVLSWALLLTIATTLVFGLVPGLRLAAGNIQEALKNSGHGISAGGRHERLRNWLVVSEVALACVLLISAGLLLRSFLNVLDVDLGFQPERAAVIKIDYADGNNGDRRGIVLRQILDSVTAIPGVENAGVTDMLPLGRNRSWGLRAKGKVYTDKDNLGAVVRIVTPGYLRAMGMKLKSGRDFSWQDAHNKQPIVIINEAAAQQHWPGQDPVGRLALLGGPDTRVIGVIANVREYGLEDALGPEMYLPEWQASPEGAELVIRTKLKPEALSASVLTTLRALNPSQPAAELLPLRRIVDHSVSPRRFFVLLVGGFAAMGLLLASLGIFGVISYSVTQRRQEIGIRMALGASAPQVQSQVMMRALRLALVGAAFGSAASLAATRWIAAMLFGTRPTDPTTFLGIIVLLALVSAVAGYLPARRASRVDPSIALRVQ